MAKSIVNLFVNDNGFNQKLKNAMNTFANLGNAANSAKGQFSAFADGIAKVAQSQELMNTALKGNPYGMLAQVATMAFGKIIEKATEASEAQKRAIEWAEQSAEREATANEAVGRSVGDLMAQYKLLQAQWVSLSNEQEKNKWIKDNQNAFKGLNLAVNDVTSAENIFVKNTSSVVAALKARAEAQAYGELYKDAIKKNAVDKANGKYQPQLITDPYYRPSEIEAQAAGFTRENKSQMYEYVWKDNADPRNPGKRREWTGRLSAEGLRRLNQNRMLGATTMENADRMLADQWAAKMVEAQRNADLLGKDFFKSSGGGGGKGGNTPKPEPQYNWKNLTSEDIQGLGKIEFVNWSAFENGLTKLPEWLSPLQQMNKELARMKELLEYAPNTEAYQEALEKIAEKEKQIEQFKNGVKLEEEGKDISKSWGIAAQSISSVGQVLANIDDPAAKVLAIVAQAVATVASGAAQAIAAKDTTSSGYAWIGAAAAIAAEMVAIISTIHSATKYAQGGIVGGNSFSGDNQIIRANSGEVVLTRAMAGNLAQQLQGNGLNGYQLEAVVTGEDLRFALRNNSRRRGYGETVTSKNY